MAVVSSGWWSCPPRTCVCFSDLSLSVASYAPLVGFASGDLGFFSEVRSALFPAISASTARLFGFVSGNLGYNSEKFRVNWIALMAPSGRALSVKVPGTGVK
ncbi:hypothetical protein ISN45_Aa01g011800 [Arabidopsis thaliana x Arabidopsis arenosa]|uniref:Uncharacterized protein n=1 Tax=Arabidopsis thaliana x Arabidopsis arenosa TaxID=1240361 RepID=A0A8T2C040_9BRAS|nr:hypothetical protein ISN45_Aa01g011800 [Arabidopsis thaliana x Arabidopsis arenosa]